MAIDEVEKVRKLKKRIARSLSQRNTRRDILLVLEDFVGEINSEINADSLNAELEVYLNAGSMANL